MVLSFLCTFQGGNYLYINVHRNVSSKIQIGRFACVFLGRFVRFRYPVAKKSMDFFLVEAKWSEKKPKSCLNLCGKISPSSYSSLAAVYTYIYHMIIIVVLTLQQYLQIYNCLHVIVVGYHYLTHFFFFFKLFLDTVVPSLPISRNDVSHRDPLL